MGDPAITKLGVARHLRRDKNPGVMTTVDVECLRCGASRLAVENSRNTEAGPCPSCGYVGWAPRGTLTPDERHELQERLAEQRDREALRPAA